MNDIKIPMGPVNGPDVEAVADARGSLEIGSRASDIEAVSVDSNDKLAAIAADVASGKIGREEAVERLLGDVMGGDVVKSVPELMKNELREMLASLLESDPYLRSLTTAISPGDIE